MPIHDKIRYINKRFTNKLFFRFAGKKNSPFALLRHVGRKSGLTYEIPIMVVHEESGFVFALTYGTNVDWYRNVKAANGAVLRWNGREYNLSNPRTLSPDEGRAAFGRFKAVILKRFGVQDFIFMDASEENPPI
jgi:deazaflavin-dependent oxidoreductase (nitroreductase family)